MDTRGGGLVSDRNNIDANRMQINANLDGIKANKKRIVSLEQKIAELKEWLSQHRKRLERIYELEDKDSKQISFVQKREEINREVLRDLIPLVRNDLMKLNETDEAIFLEVEKFDNLIDKLDGSDGEISDLKDAGFDSHNKPKGIKDYSKTDSKPSEPNWKEQLNKGLNKHLQALMNSTKESPSEPNRIETFRKIGMNVITDFAQWEQSEKEKKELIAEFLEDLKNLSNQSEDCDLKISYKYFKEKWEERLNQ